MVTQELRFLETIRPLFQDEICVCINRAELVVRVLRSANHRSFQFASSCHRFMGQVCSNLVFKWWARGTGRARCMIPYILSRILMNFQVVYFTAVKILDPIYTWF